MNFEISEIDEVINNLERIKNNVQAVSGDNEIPITELLNDKFMKQYTNFDNVQKFVKGCENSCENSFLKIDTDDAIFNEYVKNNTNFSCWAESLNQASNEWIISKIDI
jgi:hypothetical protein